MASKVPTLPSFCFIDKTKKKQIYTIFTKNTMNKLNVDTKTSSEQ